MTTSINEAGLSEATVGYQAAAFVTHATFGVLRPFIAGNAERGRLLHVMADSWSSMSTDPAGVIPAHLRFRSLLNKIQPMLRRCLEAPQSVDHSEDSELSQAVTQIFDAVRDLETQRSAIPAPTPVDLPPRPNVGDPSLPDAAPDGGRPVNHSRKARRPTATELPTFEDVLEYYNSSRDVVSQARERCQKIDANMRASLDVVSRQNRLLAMMFSIFSSEIDVAARSLPEVKRTVAEIASTVPARPGTVDEEYVRTLIARISLAVAAVRTATTA